VNSVEKREYTSQKLNKEEDITYKSAPEPRDAHESLRDHEKRTDARRLMQDWHNEQQEN